LRRRPFRGLPQQRLPTARRYSFSNRLGDDSRGSTIVPEAVFHVTQLAPLHKPLIGTAARRSPNGRGWRLCRAARNEAGLGRLERVAVEPGDLLIEFHGHEALVEHAAEVRVSSDTPVVGPTR